MTTQLHPATDYRADVDPLHRNVWPVRIGDNPTVIGYLHEHITVTLDLPEPPEPPETRWSWVFEDAEGDRLGVDESLRASRGRYRSWRSALTTFTQMHQLAVSLRAAEAHLAAERARKGE